MFAEKSIEYRLSVNTSMSVTLASEVTATPDEYQRNITLFIETHLGKMDRFPQYRHRSFPNSNICTIYTINHIDISMLQNEMINFHITGAPQINYETLIPLTIIYSLFLVIGILGNLATCIVILSNEYLRYKSINRNVVTRKMYLAFRTLLSSSPH